jgi:hypothetical protein
VPVPQYIGPATPTQVVKIRLGRFTHYYQDNPVGNKAEGEAPMGAGHQTWDQANYPCQARVGLNGKNPYYAKPWQGLWLPTSSYVVVPNVLEAKHEKKLEKQQGSVGTATIEVENILYPERGGGYHARERGAMAPLRGRVEGPANVKALAGTWLAELEAIAEAFAANEWAGKFAEAAQITIYQGYGTNLVKVFTGLIENIDSTSKPDRIVITARDFGLVFTDTHFFGAGKDPVIATPVVFVDADDAALKSDVGGEATASNEDSSGKHPATAVTDFNKATWWQTNLLGSAEQTEWVEIRLPEGRYNFCEMLAQWAGLDVYISLRPTKLTGGLAPTRKETSAPAEDMTIENKWLDKNGWVDITKKEEQLVPGVLGGVSYTRFIANFPTGFQRPPLDNSPGPGTSVAYRVGNGSILRISFRKLHATEGGFRAGLNGLHGLREATEAAAGKDQWVLTEDIADVIRILCQWAGFKEWDIPLTGFRLPKRIICFQDKSYMDVIREIAEGIGFIFFLADPAQDPAQGGPVNGEESLGIPTFRKTRVLSPDTTAEKELREAGIEANGNVDWAQRGNSAALARPGIPPPVITDRSMLTAIDLKLSLEPLSSLIRAIGITKSLPGNMSAAITSGKFVMYDLIPPWAGTPGARYADSRLAGVQKVVVEKNPQLATVDLCKNAALFIALQQAIAECEATVEFPGAPAIMDIDDHVMLMDLGTGLATRLSVRERASTFIDGENRKFVTTLVGSLIDTPDVAAIVAIINEEAPPNGKGGELEPREATQSTEGYG